MKNIKRPSRSPKAWPRWMKITVIGSILVGFLIVYVTKGDNNKAPMDNATRLRVECATSDSQLASKWADFSLMLQEAMSKDVNPTLLTKKAVAAGRDGIVATRHWLKECSSYIPDAAASYEKLIKDISPKLDSLEGN